MAEHTPGPWLQEYGALSMEVVEGDPQSRGTIFLGLYATPPEQPEATYVVLPWKWAENYFAMIARPADINLIAAAPELLSVCSDLVAEMQTLETTGGACVPSLGLMTKARATLLKVMATATD